MSVTIIYNSPPYCVFEFEGSDREGARANGGWQVAVHEEGITAVVGIE